MIAMLDTSESLDVCEAEIGYPVEQLLTPLTRFTAQRPAQEFGIDNGAFAGFNESAWLALLAREWPRRALARFVCAPDVVADAAATLERLIQWGGVLRDWPAALVLQDGQESIPVPWPAIKAVFVGGSTDWKLGRHSAALIREAKRRGLWVHVGRVNTPKRWHYFQGLGVDSVDGTGISRFSHMRRAINLDRFQGRLF